MKKLGYTQTTRDNGGPIFFFKDGKETYRLRLAGNPILLIESYYLLAGGTEFMSTYKSVSNGLSSECNNKNLEALKKAKQQTEDFVRAIVQLQEIKKSLLVIYKE